MMVGAVALAFLVTLGITALLIYSPLSKIALDQPNHRSLHTKITPRTGGLAIMMGVVAAWVCLGGVKLFLIPALLLLAICLIDDIKGLPVRWRLLAQFAITGGFTVTAFPMLWWQTVLVVLAMVWMINLYNFMDGSDGLAGGMAVFGFTSYGVAAYLHGDMQLTLMASGVVASNLAFLIFNFHPARIFMGDAGSVPLGFLAGSMGLYGWETGVWGWWFPVLVFSPFIVDASVTLCRRLLNGEKVWQAHKSHYYQKLVQTGFGHSNTAFLEYSLMLLCAVTGILLLSQPPQVLYPVFIGIVFLYLLIANRIDRRWKTFSASGLS